jgi:hypothetical protein
MYCSPVAFVCDGDFHSRSVSFCLARQFLNSSPCGGARSPALLLSGCSFFLNFWVVTPPAVCPPPLLLDGVAHTVHARVSYLPTCMMMLTKLGCQPAKLPRRGTHRSCFRLLNSSSDTQKRVVSACVVRSWYGFKLSCFVTHRGSVKHGLSGAKLTV